MTDSRNQILVKSYRHDAHKLNGQSHDNAPETFAGVQVNQTVPLGADRDAAALSRPSGEPEQTVANHESRYRLSLVEGDSRYEPQEFTRAGIESDVRSLLTVNDPETLHGAWLNSEVASAFNESVFYPYTSLKYHTLLVAALVDNYRSGHEFGDIQLVVNEPDEMIPHRTVFMGARMGLRLDARPRGRPSASLGPYPHRSWASTWNRL